MFIRAYSAESRSKRRRALSDRRLLLRRVHRELRLHRRGLDSTPLACYAATLA